jgi:hypothetical protein
VQLAELETAEEWINQAYDKLYAVENELHALGVSCGHNAFKYAAEARLALELAQQRV